MVKIFLIKNRNAFNTKWVCDFATKLDFLGYDVSLVCDDKQYDPKKDAPISNSVRKINLGSFWGFIAQFKFKKLIEEQKPDLCFAYFIKDLFNLYFCLDKTKVVMMMHNQPIEVFEKFNFIEKIIAKKALKKVAVIQVLMPEFSKQVTDFVGNVKVEIIPNQVTTKEQKKDYQFDNKTIIHVGQIAKKTKRQHLLIEAFSKISHKHPEWKVHFFGHIKKGKHTKYYKECVARIKELNLEKQIFFKGFSKDITLEYLQSEINTLPSRAEGFGYGLADGLALGLPSVGFIDAPGVNEIIVDGKSGFLIKDIDEYAHKLDLLISEKDLRKKMGEYGRYDMQNRYNPEKVMLRWKKLIDNVLKHSQINPQ